MSVEIPPNLRWACRRGMLELDVLLGNFLEEAFSLSSPAEQAVFIRLLESNDQELFMWLTAREQPKDPEFALIIEKIRDHARHRNSGI